MFQSMAARNNLQAAAFLVDVHHRNPGVNSDLPAWIDESQILMQGYSCLGAFGPLTDKGTQTNSVAGHNLFQMRPENGAYSIMKFSTQIFFPEHSEVLIGALPAEAVLGRMLRHPGLMKIDQGGCFFATDQRANNIALRAKLFIQSGIIEDGHLFLCAHACLHVADAPDSNVFAVRAL